MPQIWNDDDQPPHIMGILNVTPDSFSDGAHYQSVDRAVTHARSMAAEGAQLIDVGGESTRPGAAREPADVQRRRVVPVIRAIRERLEQSLLISIDTTLADVASAALDAGADMINDISAGRDSPDMFVLAAERNAPVVLMHMQGEPETMQIRPYYHDVLAEVSTFLIERAAKAIDAGVAPHNIVLDPGIGFGKRRRDNLDLLAGLSELTKLGYPVLLGASRKRFMGRLCRARHPKDLVGATCATTALAATAGVRIVRVHDVRANRQAADVAWAISRRHEAI